jgi:hypothetical protein
MLNWDAIGAIGELTAAVAVIGSLLFVGSQLRQAIFIEQANAQRDMLRQSSDFMSSTSKDPELFEAVRECLQEFNEAAPLARDRFNSWAFTLLFITESAYYMHENNFITTGHSSALNKQCFRLLLPKAASSGGL